MVPLSRLLSCVIGRAVIAYLFVHAVVLAGLDGQHSSGSPALDTPPPSLPDKVAVEVVALHAKLRQLEELGLTAPTREVQDAAFGDAVELAERALEIHKKHQGNTLELVRWRNARGEPAEWPQVIAARMQLEHLHHLRGLDDQARSDLASLIGSDVQFAKLFEAGKYADAHELTERKIAIRRRLLGDGHVFTLTSIGDMGNLLRAEGRLAEAEPYLAEALAGKRRVLGDDHPITLKSINDMGVLMEVQGRLADAEPYYAEALAGDRRVLGDDHPYTLSTIGNIGILLLEQGRLADAEHYVAEALAGRRRVLGDEHPRTLGSINNMGALLRAQGRLADAEPYYAEALAGIRSALGDDHPQTLTSINNMGILLHAQGRLADAEFYSAEALAGRRRVLGDDHWHTLGSINNMGAVLLAQGRLADAEPYYAEALASYRTVLGIDHPQTLKSINNMGFLLTRQGRLADAEPYYVEALAGRRRVLRDDHPDTMVSLLNMGVLLWASGRLADAEPYCAQALAAFRRVLGDDHEHTLIAISHKGALLVAQGRLADAEPYYAEALATAEYRRTDVIGGASERAALSEMLNLAGIAVRYAALLADTDRPAMALTVIERGRGRAALDLLSSAKAGGVETYLRKLKDPTRVALYEAATKREQDALVALREAESRMAAARDDEARAELNELVKDRRRQLRENTAAVFAELRGVFPITDPLTSDDVLAGLAAGEALVSFVWNKGRLLALIATEAGVESFTIAGDQKGKNLARAAAKALREAVSARPSGPFDSATIESARSVLLPDELRSRLADAKSITVIPDGPLHALPMELLLPDVPIAYAPSATIALDRRRVSRQRSASLAGAVVLGHPDFGSEIAEPDYPQRGVLLSVVREGSNADIGGLRRRDVLLRYGEHELALLSDLRPAIQSMAAAPANRGVEPNARSVSVKFWRDCETLEVALAPGVMGVIPSQAPPAEGLRSMAYFDRSADQQSAIASSLDQYRLYGGALTPLPGTGREAMAVAALIEQNGGSVKLLVGKEATAPNLAQAVLNSPPRFLHLATHGLTGTADRPNEASLALTRPEEPTVDDIGFLTLDEITTRWLGRLEGTELVTLSACDTGLGVAQGDTVMSLPLGFFAAGAETVVASLWKVDDKATALLMTRLYENLLGAYRDERSIDGEIFTAETAMPKLSALREAKSWLRTLTLDERDAMLARLNRRLADVTGVRGDIVERGQAVPVTLSRPYEHPYYWAAFVLIGSPE